MPAVLVLLRSSLAASRRRLRAQSANLWWLRRQKSARSFTWLPQAFSKGLRRWVATFAAGIAATLAFYGSRACEMAAGEELSVRARSIRPQEGSRLRSRRTRWLCVLSQGQHLSLNAKHKWGFVVRWNFVRRIRGSRCCCPYGKKE